ncbi:hypothetical protein PVAP13_8NG160401 [Panicum virgatum]|uniref:Endonuclease/exonuclease/phosphatase domain-containing protein n=1 Tax=Panicum virgatum TaxID=38727 RepID=A0A8T0P4E4_PANVG|nr:hypothetical protein PVAP13_8NG160401 [Panicum virgatum]
MTSETPNILSWNVRGLNTPAHCLTVHETVSATPCHIACFQETKLHTIDQSLANFLGGYRLNKFAYKPAHGTRGGILVAWNENIIEVHNTAFGRYSLTTMMTVRSTGQFFKLITVYGPSRRPEKEAFLQHLRDLKPQDDTNGSF